jgi:hypothetical protein
MNRNFLRSAIFLLGLAAAAGAQTGALLQNTLTNHDIVVLAQAGFNENFIADLISMSRTRFDTSVTGLAEMAKEGLTERLIRVMLVANVMPQPGSTPPASAAETTAMVPAELLAPPVDTSSPGREPKRSESAMAIANQAPYYRTSSFFWGFWKRKTGVGASLRTDQPIGVQLGTAYGQVQRTSPAGVPRYVVVP